MRVRRHFWVRSIGLPLLGFLAACAQSTGTGRGSRPPQASTIPADAGFKPSEIERIERVQPIVQETSSEFGIEAELINAMIWVESRFQTRAKGPSGSRGLMQLMPATSRSLAKQLGVQNRPYDPEFNIRAGSYYLSKMRDRFGDPWLAVAAYQAGPGNVRKWLKAGRDREDFPDFSQAYVAKVQKAHRRFQRHATANPSPSPEPASANAENSEERPGPIAVASAARPAEPSPPVARNQAEAEPEPVRTAPEEAPLPEPASLPETTFRPSPELDRPGEKSPPPGWRVSVASPSAPTQTQENPLSDEARDEPARVRDLPDL